MASPEIHSILQNTSVWKALSPLGHKIRTPKGIFYWSARAKAGADIDATIGTAQDDNGDVSHLNAAEKFAGPEIMSRVSGGKIFGYAPIPGVLGLRKKWLAKILQDALDVVPKSERKNLADHATLPVVVNGITHGLSIASRMFLKPGQVLITADKSWENYSQIFTAINGIKVVGFPLFRHDTGAHGGGKLHLDAMIGMCREIAQSQGKVVLLLNFPHNRTGFMPSAHECELIGQRIKGLCRSMPTVPFVVLLDDAYEGYVYDSGGYKASLLPYIFSNEPNLTVIKNDGISKVLLAYGYRVAFLTGFFGANGQINASVSEEFESIVGGFVRGEISQVNHHGQVMAEALLDDPRTVSAQRKKVIATLRDRWHKMMGALEKGYKKYGYAKLWADPCNGGFFCYLNLAGGINPVEIAEKLLTEKRVGVVPSEQGLRVAFCGVPKVKIAEMVKAIFEVVYG